MHKRRSRNTSGVLGGFDREFLRSLNRTELHRALQLLRRQDARPHESNPAAAQYDRLATVASVRAEYRRRGWKVPSRTRWEMV